MKKKRKRVRGGASHPCPKCGSVTHVLVTRRDDNTVSRHRECTKCRYTYHTQESSHVQRLPA